MSKRTKSEIERDYKRIIKASKSVNSIAQLIQVTGLSYGEIKCSFKEHPLAYKRMKERLLSARKKEVSVEDSKIEVKEEITYVIDASIVGSCDLKERINEIIANKNAIIIITSITINELERLQNKKHDDFSIEARYILRLAAENSDKFRTVLISENYATQDDSIISFCANYGKKVILLTSDKTMSLKARMYDNIEDVYLKKKFNFNFHRNKQKKTLLPTCFTDGKLYINAHCTRFKMLSVYSENIEYTHGLINLKVNDDIFLAKVYDQYITFSHFKIVNISKEKNCILIYSKRVYFDSQLNFSNARYKSFIKNFMSKIA